MIKNIEIIEQVNYRIAMGKMKPGEFAIIDDPTYPYYGKLVLCTLSYNEGNSYCLIDTEEHDTWTNCKPEFPVKLLPSGTKIIITTK